MLFKPLESFKRMIEVVKVVRESCSFSRTCRLRSRRPSSFVSSVRVSFKSPTKTKRRSKLALSSSRG